MLKHGLRFLVMAALGVLTASAHALVVLQYHHVSDQTPASTSVTPAVFERHMGILAEQGFTVIDMSTFLKVLANDAPLPDKTALITFDDGYASIYHAAWPILKKRGWPFTVFINTSHHQEADGKTFMSWEQIQILAEAGVTIGNHSRHHTHMVRRKEDETDKQYLARMKEEVLGAQRVIKKHLGEQPKVFAYPFGEYNPQLAALLGENGYVAFGQQSGPVARWNHTAALPRFPFGGHYGDVQDFTTKINTVPYPLDKLTVAVNNKPLATPVLPAPDTIPELRLHAADQTLLKRTTCFASGQGQVNTVVKNDYLAVTANKPFGPGRSRYNCTASAGEGRFYWLSDTFINKKKDGSWYEE